MSRKRSSSSVKGLERERENVSILVSNSNSNNTSAAAPSAPLAAAAPSHTNPTDENAAPSNAGLHSCSLSALSPNTNMSKQQSKKASAKGSRSRSSSKKQRRHSASPHRNPPLPQTTVSSLELEFTNEAILSQQSSKRQLQQQQQQQQQTHTHKEHPLWHNEDVVQYIFGFFCCRGAFEKEERGGVHLSPFGRRPASNSLASTQSSTVATIQNLFLVSQRFHRLMSSKPLWSHIFAPTRPHVFKPSIHANPVKCSKLLKVSNLIPFINLGKRHVGSEGELIKIKERTTWKVYALKKTKLKSPMSSLITNQEHEEFNQKPLPYPVLREISVLKNLSVKSCPNISVLRGLHFFNDDLYRIYDYVSVTVDDKLKIAKDKKGQPFDPIVRKSLMKQLLTGLSCLHRSGIVHRNIKPKHLLLDYTHPSNPTLKISDFALTRTTCYPKRDFTPDQVTIWYRCPEILMGDREYGTMVDVWSAGCVFGEICRGDAMFRGGSEIGMLFKIFKCLGTPTEKTWKKLNRLENYNAEVLPKFEGGMLDAMLGDVEDGAKDLLAKMLQCDPSSRISAVDALQDPYFSESADSPPQISVDPNITLYKSLKESEVNLQEIILSPKTTHVHPKHRAILADWLIEIIQVFEMSNRTAFLALGFLDKFFVDDNAVDKKKLQLIGATCLLIASKCEDVAYIGTKDLAFCGDNTYKENHLVKMERKILNTLDFELNIPTVFDFVQCQKDYVEEMKGAEGKIGHLADYISEIALQSSLHLTFPMSLIGTCVSSLSLLLHGRSAFPPSLEKISSHAFEDLRECMGKLWTECIRLQQQTELIVIKKKYSVEEKGHVGGYVLNSMHWDFATEKAKVLAVVDGSNE